jgi:putative membrane protein
VELSAGNERPNIEENVMTWKRMLVANLGLSLAMATGALAAGDPQEFTSKAGTAGLYEVRAAEVARQKAQDGETRQFADQMINDHQKANQELRDLAKTKSWTLPASLDAKHQEMLDRLGRLQGAEFDREYAKQQLQAHQEAVSLFKEQSERGTDSQLKAWASGKLPTLQKHLEHARELGSNGSEREGSVPDRSLDRSTPSESAPRGSTVPDGGVRR